MTLSETKVFRKGHLVCFEICYKQDHQETLKSGLVRDFLVYI